MPLKYFAGSESQKYVRIRSLQIDLEIIETIIEGPSGFHLDVTGTQSLGGKSILEKGHSGNG